MAADTPQTERDRLRFEAIAHETVCGFNARHHRSLELDRGVYDKACSLLAERLIAAGFGDVAALTAEVERLRNRARMAYLYLNFAPCIDCGQEWVEGLQHDGCAALAGTHDQERDPK